jgi:hypothetical protein
MVGAIPGCFSALRTALLGFRVAKATAQTKDELENMVQRTLRRLQKLPNIVAGFFRAPTCRYAAV